MKRIITLCSLCAVMLLTPDKAEAQLLKKLGNAVNEVSNVIGNKNDKKGSKKQKSGTVQGAGIQQTDTEVYGGETENNQEEDGVCVRLCGQAEKGEYVVVIFKENEF